MLMYHQLKEVLEKKVEEWQKKEKQSVGEVLDLLREGAGDYVSNRTPPQDVVAALMSVLSNQEEEELREYLSNPEVEKEYDLWMLLSEMHPSSLD